MFEVSVSLTVTGLSNWIDVVGIIYSYLQLIDPRGGPPEWIHKEIKQMAQLEYDFCDEEEDSDFVENLCVTLSQFDRNAPALDLLPSDDLFFDWDQGDVQDILAALAPCNAHIQLISSVFKSTILRRDTDSQCDESSESEDVSDDNG